MLDEKTKKHMKINELYMYAVGDRLYNLFFDLDSDEMLDEKIQVLTDLKNGKTPGEIPNYYKILELYPKNGEMWDQLSFPFQF